MSSFSKILRTLLPSGGALFAILTVFLAGCASDSQRTPNADKSSKVALPRGYTTVVLAPVTISGAEKIGEPGRTAALAIAAGEASAKEIARKGYTVVVCDVSLAEKILKDNGKLKAAGDTAPRYAVLKGNTVSVSTSSPDILAIEKDVLKAFARISINAPVQAGDDVFANSRNTSRGSAVFNLVIEGNDGFKWTSVGRQGERQYYGSLEGLEPVIAAKYAGEVAGAMPELRP